MEEPLENLKLALSSPRPRAPGTISSYLSLAGQYITWLNVRIPPTETDLRRYFLERRKGGLSESSLSTLFWALRKLHLSNGWDWPFSRDDRPIPPSDVNVPAFTEEEIATLIRNRNLYTEGETFYLALSTTLGVRREELARVAKKDIKDNTILIHTRKGGPERWHLIPDELMPVITAYKPTAHWASAQTAMFHRIMEKGLGGHRKGYGWHSIRYTLDTLGLIACAKHDLYPGLWAEYMRWAKKTIGLRFAGSAMAGHYTQTDILSSDRFGLDRLLLPIHPLLPYWR